MSAPVEALRNVPLFAGLEERDLEQLAKQMHERRFPEGSEVTREGSTGAGFFVIAEGNAEVTIGGEHRATLGRGDHFGEIALIDDGVRSASIVAAIIFQSLAGLLLGLLAPFVTRFLVSRRVSKKREDFQEQLPDNLDVLAGAMRTGHSTMGALSVMVDSADEPSKGEFRRVLQDEQLGVPLDDALMVMARRMASEDAEQIALVMRLQREAGGNTAEVLDRVAEVIRGRMELRRLVDVLTAQARISRWILTGLPIFVLFSLIFTGGDFLDPMINSLVGRIALVFAAIMVMIGSFWIKRLAKMDV